MRRIETRRLNVQPHGPRERVPIKPVKWPTPLRRTPDGTARPLCARDRVWQLVAITGHDLRRAPDGSARPLDDERRGLSKGVQLTLPLHFGLRNFSK
jgi:hypothetical protein